MTLREKLMHYTNDLGDVDLKQLAIATIEHIAQYMDEDKLLHHSRPLAISYLALTEDASGPVVHGHRVDGGGFYARCSQCDGVLPLCANYCPNCGAKMDGERKDGGDG